MRWCAGVNGSPVALGDGASRHQVGREGEVCLIVHVNGVDPVHQGLEAKGKEVTVRKMVDSASGWLRTPAAVCWGKLDW